MDWGRFWDILAWIGFGITIMYFILKAFGVLNSPLTIDIVTIIGASIFVGRHIQKVEHISKDVDVLKNKTNSIDNRLVKVEDRLDNIDNRLVKVENKISV